VALLKADELEDLQKRYASSEGELVLRPDQRLASVHWEGRRLIRAVLRNDEALRVRIDALPQPLPQP
jgi:processive 1,2-diacylglycerol beta-glucosyltransferase